MARQSREARLLAAFPTTRERQAAIGWVLGQLPPLYEHIGLVPDINQQTAGGYTVQGWSIAQQVTRSARSGPRIETTRQLFVPLPGARPEPALGILSRTSSPGHPGAWRDIDVRLGDVGRYDHMLEKGQDRLPRGHIARFCSSRVVMVAIHTHLLELAATVPPEPGRPLMELPVRPRDTATNMAPFGAELTAAPQVPPAPESISESPMAA